MTTSDLTTGDGGIEIDNLSVHFGKQRVLSNISLQVSPGEIIALIGASGCGKSTLLRTIAGLTTPTAGKVLLGKAGSGDPLTESPEFGYVFQDATLVPWRNTHQNITLPLEIGKRSRLSSTNDSINQRVLSALRDVELEPRVASQLPHELSGGMRMRVSLARALIGDPSILLLDEPFGALDDLLRAKLHDLLLRLHARRPRTIVFVTHNIDEALLLSDRIVVLGPSDNCEGASKPQLSEFDNPLPKPRSSETRRQAEFATAYSEITELLQQANP